MQLIIAILRCFTMRNVIFYLVFALLMLRFGEAHAQLLQSKEYDVHATVLEYDCHFTVDNKAVLVRYRGNKLVKQIVVPKQIVYKGTAFKVVSLGYQCFANLKELEAVELPGSLQIIEARAFEYCSKLNKINFPPLLQEIEHAAFSMCIALDTISLPASLHKIGWRVFSECNQLTHIHVEDGSQYFSSVDGVLFNRKKDTLYLFPPNKPLLVFASNDYSGIVEGAFDNNQHLKRIRFPDSLLYLPPCMYKCVSLEQIELGPLTEQISFHMNIQYCSQLQHIVVDSLNLYYTSVDGVLYDKTFARLFKCPDAKKSLVIDPRCWVLESYALLGCKQLKVLDIPAGIKKIKFNALSQTQFDEVRFFPMHPPEGSYEFGSHTAVYVPLSAHEAYVTYLKNQFYWRNKSLIVF